MPNAALLDIENSEYKNYLEMEILQIELIMNADDESFQGCVLSTSLLSRSTVLSWARLVLSNKTKPQILPYNLPNEINNNLAPVYFTALVNPQFFSVFRHFFGGDTFSVFLTASVCFWPFTLFSSDLSTLPTSASEEMTMIMKIPQLVDDDSQHDQDGNIEDNQAEADEDEDEDE